ncbi:MAG: MFS transporter [Microthrixaceae bacterium]
MSRVEQRAFERRWWILAVLCFSLLVIVLDNSILNVAIPTIIKELDATNSQIQWIIDAYTLSFAGLLLTAGSLGDRFGRRPALQVGFVIFGLGSVASALVGSADHLIMTRTLMGVGGAVIMPATLSIITNVFPPEERGQAIGVWAGVAGLGAALGPLAGGFLVEHFYFGSVFLVNVPIVIFGLVTGFLLIPNSKDPHAPRVDAVGAILSVAGLTLLLFAIIEAPGDGWASTKILLTMAAGVVISVAFVLWERHSDHPMLDVSFFRNPRFSAASGSIAVIFFAMFGSIFLLTQYFQFVLDYSPFGTGIRMLPFAGSLMLFAPLSAVFVKWVGTKFTVATGMALVAVGLVTMSNFTVTSSYGSIVWRLMLVAAGMGMTMAPATDSVMGSLPLAKAGVGSAVNDTTRQVGGALGVAVIGSIMASIYGDKVAHFLSTLGAPEQAIDAARNSLGGAAQVAADPRAPASLGQELMRTANQAFVDAMHRGYLLAAAMAVVGVLIALLFLPSRASQEDLDMQLGEWVAEARAADDLSPLTKEVPRSGPGHP